MKIKNIFNELLTLFGERLALLPLIFVFSFVFIFERAGEVQAQETIFKQNFNIEGLQVIVGSLENVNFGSNVLPEVKTEEKIKEVSEQAKPNVISVKVESVRVPVTPTPTPTVVAVAESGDIWDQLAKCESGGNWSINTGNGYYGGLQFSQGAWNSVGGAGLPSDASRDEQIEKGKALQAKRGWGAWGLCAKKLNLN